MRVIESKKKRDLEKVREGKREKGIERQKEREINIEIDR